VPMILAGPEVPEGLVCHEPVSLVDCFPTVIECVGAPPHPDDRDLPGASLFDRARGTGPRRTILSEYHAAGAATGAFIIRGGPFKYIHYVGMPPQLFGLDADPQETRDLAHEPGYQGLVADCGRALLGNRWLRILGIAFIMDVMPFIDRVNMHGETVYRSSARHSARTGTSRVVGNQSTIERSRSNASVVSPASALRLARSRAAFSSNRRAPCSRDRAIARSKQSLACSR